MIYVSSGHLQGIGLEIFLKSFLLLNPNDKKQITLIVSENSFYRYLTDCSIPYELFKNLNLNFIDVDLLPESTSSLTKCLELIKPNDILITLPTSKDQLILKGVNQAGYTEFFRNYFDDQTISMFFKSYNENVLLITDHISLRSVSDYIDSQLINKKIETCIKGYNQYFECFNGVLDEIIVSGINPHAGENGILGKEEKHLKLNSFNPVSLIGPVPGDTLHVYKNPLKNQLFVYMFHDQALASFKARNLFTGLNITFGLPFLRLSVDHGTAFNLYAKNKASLTGMMYLLKTALEVHSNGNK